MGAVSAAEAAEEEAARRFAAEIERARARARAEEERARQEAEEAKERALQRRMLEAGDVFLKHGRRGNPHRRLVWYDPVADAVRWGKVGKKPTRSTALNGDRDMSFAQVSNVVAGQTTAVFHRSSSGPEKQHLCFSLVAPGRTLDLEADSGPKRDKWLSAFVSLLKQPVAERTGRA